MKCPNCRKTLDFGAVTWADGWRGVGWCDACGLSTPGACAGTYEDAINEARKVCTAWERRMERRIAKKIKKEADRE